ncbi:plasmid mobilization protein [Sphingomonas sp. CJ20]
MATQLRETRSTRVVVLVSPEEKRQIAANAEAADMSMSDFMRTAAERYTEPTDAEQALIGDLLAQLESANARTEAALARLEAARAVADDFDEDRYRAQVREELLADDAIDWDALSSALSGWTRQ